jgi:outer membrane murein-binding lipoprotein Lpp
VPTNGQSRCRNLFLGLPKNCTTSGCAFQLLQGPKNARAHLVWSIEPVTEVSKPLPPFAGLTMNGPYSYLFNQGAESATIRYSKLPEARDFQIILKTPDLNTIWFADKPYRLGGTIPLASFVQGFSQAIGIPNAVITGTSSSNSSDLIKMVVTLSSPLWNATTQTLSFSATRVGSPSSAEQALKNNGAIQMQSVNVFVDNAGLEALTFGAQILNQYVAKGLFWQVASFALVTGLDMISGSSSSSSGATTIQYLQNISAQVQEILSVVQVIDSQVTALVSDVQSLGQDYQSFTANASIANDLFNSGPSSNQGVGTVLSCPNSGSWTNNILFGSSSNAMNLQLALNDLYDSITGTSTQTGVNLIAQLFNQAGGNVCSSSGCDYGAYNTVPYPVSTASPAAQVVEAMNQYVATMINGLSLCNIAANFVSNATALQQSCGYTVTPGEGSILADYCTATTGLNGQNLLTDIYNVVTSSIQTTEVGWQGEIHASV